MGKIITQCPSCNSSKLHAVKIDCSDCNTRFEGQFAIPSLLQLSEGDLQFILDFVRCSGSLKEMAAKQKISYPTLRNKLNVLIEIIENLEIEKDGSRSQILQLLENGTITAQEAANMLKKL